MNILKKKRNQSSMKNFMTKKSVIGALMVLITVGAFAQHERRGFKNSEMTPEQIAELQTKKMTLGLELTEAQQNKVFDLNKKKAIERMEKRKKIEILQEEGEKSSNKNSFERKNARLDAQLAHQEEMKSILNDDQFETWKKTRKHKAHKMKKMKKQKRMKQRVKGKKRKGRKERK